MNLGKKLWVIVNLTLFQRSLALNKKLRTKVKRIGLIFSFV